MHNIPGDAHGRKLVDMLQQAIKLTYFLNQKHNILFNFTNVHIPVIA
jgi:hypothetical protein